VCFPVYFHGSVSPTCLWPDSGQTFYHWLPCFICPHASLVLTHWLVQASALSILLLYLTRLSHFWLTCDPDNRGSKHLWT
jgi:hypothetical protein